MIDLHATGLTPVCKEYPLFGDAVEIVVYDSEEDIALPIIEDAYALGVRLQRIFNLYDPRSELSILNRDRTGEGSPDLRQVLRLALALCERSGGAYDIAQGKRFLARKAGLPESSHAPRSAASIRDIRMDADNITLEGDAWLDLGSVAKGYIAKRMAERLTALGVEHFLIDARGDLVIRGPETVVDIAHPRAPGAICAIRVDCSDGKSIATSGDYRQFQGTYDRSHIMNKNDAISVTVVADDCALADACATLLMVCDPTQRESVASEYGVQAMTIDADLKISHYNGFNRLVVDEEGSRSVQTQSAVAIP